MVLCMRGSGRHQNEAPLSHTDWKVLAVEEISLELSLFLAKLVITKSD